MTEILLTKNFTVAEMRCKCGMCDGGYMNKDFMDELQYFRNKWGKPMTINSAARCPDWNAKQGGAANSYHLSNGHGAIAVDVKVKPHERYAFVELAIASGWTGIGIYDRHIHLDRRVRARMWGGSYS